MSSPFDPETKRGTEESLEAISRTVKWASRIDTTNDVTETDVSTFIKELQNEREELLEKYQIKTTEVAIDNFVSNQEEKVISILTGDFEEKYEVLNELEEYIANYFGYVSPLSLDKKELLWLVAQEVKYHRGGSFGVDEYDEELNSVNIDSQGERPSVWED